MSRNWVWLIRVLCFRVSNRLKSRFGQGCCLLNPWLGIDPFPSSLTWALVRFSFSRFCWIKTPSSSLLISLSSILHHETEQSSKRLFSITDLFGFPPLAYRKTFVYWTFWVSKSLAQVLMIRKMRTCRYKEVYSGKRTGNSFKYKSAIYQSHSTFSISLMNLISSVSEAHS